MFISGRAQGPPLLENIFKALINASQNEGWFASGEFIFQMEQMFMFGYN